MVTFATKTVFSFKPNIIYLFDGFVNGVYDLCMTTLTIPKQLINQKIILVPAKEYKEFLNWKQITRNKTIKEFTPTKKQLKTLAQARQNFAKGNFVTVKN